MTLSEVLQEYGLEAAESQLRSLEFVADDHAPQLLEAVASALDRMCEHARAEGVTIAAASGYRSVARQTEIWNGKFQKAVAMMGDRQSSLVKVLEYSAPPGWSRHHWGCDVDLVAGELIHDARLESEDWSEGGPCHEADRWLEKNALSYGFIKPYDTFRGGFLAEPWHWSFAPIAIPLLAKFRRLDWKVIAQQHSFEGSDLLARQMRRLLHDFVENINPALV